MNYNYIRNFHASRKNRIGASDIPYLIPHPVKQIESLAAYTDSNGTRFANTALDLYNMKINNTRSESSFPAEMGHYLEGKLLQEFISDNIDKQIANDFFYGYTMYKMDFLKLKSVGNHLHPESYNNTPFKHNTEAGTEWGIAHGDILYDVDPKYLPILYKAAESKDSHPEIIKINGMEIDLFKPFLIEAKTARYWSANRKEDPYTGYDLNLFTWQGIPLKVYFQIQFQMLLYNVDICYVALLFDTSSKHYWQIKANKKHQNELQQIAIYMKKCIDTKTPPKDLLMNSSDIKSLYPDINEDFREVKGDELKEIIQTSKKYIESKRQEKAWSQRKAEYEERMSIYLKDTQVLKGNINGILLNIAKWKETGGAERITGLKNIKARADGAIIERYLKKKGLINQDKKNRKPSITIKEEDLQDGTF